MTGQWLHAFTWLKDNQIGALPATWNHLVGYDIVPQTIPCGIHFTSGIPTMPGHEDDIYADLWRAERDSRRLPGKPLPLERLRGLAAKFQPEEGVAL